MNFIRRIGRDEIYIKYVHQLVNVSISICFILLCSTNSTADASAVPKLCRSGFDFEATFRPARLESEHLYWSNGRSWSAPAIALPQEGNFMSFNFRLSWYVLGFLCC